MREIKAFIVVAEELNFRKAAEILNITQPPLTRLINQMEADLGVKLFTRSTRKVELTGAGLHLFNESRQLIDSLNKLEKEVRSIGKLKTGQLKAGLTGPVFHSELPRILSSFKEQFKGIKLDMSEVSLKEQLTGLKNGKIDVTFSFKKIEDKDIGNQEIINSELGFLIGPSHRLAKNKSIKLTDLKGETLIFHGKHENLGFQSDFRELLVKKNIPVKVYYKGVKESCPHLAMMDKGLLLSTREMAKARMASLQFVSLSDYSSKLKIYVNWNKSNSSLSLKAFLNFFSENIDAPSSDLDCHFGL